MDTPSRIETELGTDQEPRWREHAFRLLASGEMILRTWGVEVVRHMPEELWAALACAKIRRKVMGRSGWRR